MPLTVAILTNDPVYLGNPGILFPVIRNETRLARKGIKISFFHTHQALLRRSYDRVMLIHRYFHRLYGTTAIEDFEPLIAFLRNLKSKAERIIFFDAGDSTGSRELPVVPYVDRFLKKQIFRDTSLYSRKGMARIWLDRQPSDGQYEPCPAEEESKIGIAWNIGMTDFRPMSGLASFCNRFGYSLPKTTPVQRPREFISGFRGALRGSHPVSEQRNRLIKLLMKRSGTRYFSGPRVTKRRYRKELAASQATVSPFGWGEICYRDFEAFLNGSALIKPSVEHLMTWPDFFQPYKTYIPLAWDLSDLHKYFDMLENDPKSLETVARDGQDSYITKAFDDDLFVDHFLKCINF